MVLNGTVVAFACTVAAPVKWTDWCCCCCSCRMIRLLDSADVLTNDTFTLQRYTLSRQIVFSTVWQLAHRICVCVRFDWVRWERESVKFNCYEEECRRSSEIGAKHPIAESCCRCWANMCPNGANIPLRVVWYVVQNDGFCSKRQKRSCCWQHREHTKLFLEGKTRAAS